MRLDKTLKFLNVTDVVILGEGYGCEYHTHASRGKIIKCAPISGRDIQSLIGAAQWKIHGLYAIREVNREAAAGGYYQLLGSVMAVASAKCSGRHVIHPVYPADVKRNLRVVLHEGKASAWVEQAR